MSTPVIAFLGWDDRRTFLVYHLAWMYAELGYKVVAVDLNPQARLTTSFLPEEKLGELWYSDKDSREFTITDSLMWAVYATGSSIYLQPVGREVGPTDRLNLVVGDPFFTHLEREFSSVWVDSSKSNRVNDLVSELSGLFQHAASEKNADLVLVDLGLYPSSAARTAWTASTHGILSVSTDPLSVRGLETLGKALSIWKISAAQTVTKRDPEGYVVLSGPLRIDQPSHFLETKQWTIPELYRRSFLENDPPETSGLTVREDPHCLGVLRETSGLLDMAREARKPVFLLKPADGAIGSLSLAVQDAYRDFERLALRIAGRVGLPPIP